MQSYKLYHFRWIFAQQQMKNEKIKKKIKQTRINVSTPNDYLAVVCRTEPIKIRKYEMQATEYLVMCAAHTSRTIQHTDTHTHIINNKMYNMRYTVDLKPVQRVQYARGLLLLLWPSFLYSARSSPCTYQLEATSTKNSSCENTMRLVCFSIYLAAAATATATAITTEAIAEQHSYSFFTLQ